MDLQAFRATLERGSTPETGEPLLEALWREAKGDWDAAHEIAQSIEGPLAAWVHAHLHRKEDDRSNAAYWYRRAPQDTSALSLDEEWDAISTSLLGDLGERKGRRSSK